MSDTYLDSMDNMYLLLLLAILVMIHISLVRPGRAGFRN